MDQGSDDIYITSSRTNPNKNLINNPKPWDKTAASRETKKSTIDAIKKSNALWDKAKGNEAWSTLFNKDASSTNPRMPEPDKPYPTPRSKAEINANRAAVERNNYILKHYGKDSPEIQEIASDMRKKARNVPDSILNNGDRNRRSRLLAVDMDKPGNNLSNLKSGESVELQFRKGGPQGEALVKVRLKKKANGRWEASCV